MTEEMRDIAGAPPPPPRPGAAAEKTPTKGKGKRSRRNTAEVTADTVATFDFIQLQEFIDRLHTKAPQNVRWLFGEKVVFEAKKPS